jgi:hypothetical protein
MSRVGEGQKLAKSIACALGSRAVVRSILSGILPELDDGREGREYLDKNYIFMCREVRNGA